MTANDYEVDGRYGKQLPYDRNLKAPLWRKRSCTDVPCLLLFVCFIGGWIFVAQYAYRNGDLNKLLVPTDSFNQKCGMDSAVLHKKYLFFFQLEKCIDALVPITGCPTPQVCVEKCPDHSFLWDEMKKEGGLSWQDLKSRLICLTDEIRDNLKSIEEADEAIKANRCASWYIKSSPFLNRCVWEFSPKVCEYIPPFLLQRNQRDTHDVSPRSTKIDVRNEKELQALALTTMFPRSQKLVMPNTNRGINGRIDENMSSTSSSSSSMDGGEQPRLQCQQHTELGETVIKEKMLQTDTKLAKFIGNVVAHFTERSLDTQLIGENVVEDILNSGYVLLTVLMLTMFVSLIFIALMRWLASPILWTSIIGVLVGLGVGIYFSIMQYKLYHNSASVTPAGLSVNAAVNNILQDERFWLYLSIALAICLVVLVLVLIVLRKRISIAVALIKEGSKAVSSVKSTVFFPVLSWILYIGLIAYVLAVGLYLGSIGNASFRMARNLNVNVSNTEQCVCEGPAADYKVGQPCDPNLFAQHCYNKGSSSFLGVFRQMDKSSPCIETSCSFVRVKHPMMINWFIVYNVFGFLWLMFFIGAFNDMVLAVTFATWYWTFKKRDVPFFTLSKAIFQTVFYHLGTLAFGSLILAICRMIRLVLEYLERKLKKMDNAFSRAIFCCLKCFFWLLETFLRFLSKNAYIMCAIHGKNFCTSARDAFQLTMRNFLRVVTLDKVTDFLFFISKLLLTGAAGTGTYFFLVNNADMIPLHYVAVPVTIVSICAFLITSVFFSVYSMAVDTLFLCFLEDIERNDGTPEKPYYMSKHLMKILGKRNKPVPRIQS